MSTSTLNTGTPSGLDLHRSCVCSHSLWEVLRALVLLCVDGLVSLVSSSGSHTFLSPLIEHGDVKLVPRACTPTA